jgi:DNA-binding CsgD family transcriptional regulator
MLYYLVYIIFILSVALTAGGVVIASKLRNRYNHEIFSALLYFQVFIYAFGFYGIWGQELIKAFLPAYIPPDLLLRISNTAILLGFPFLLFAWLMLIRFSFGISGRKNSNWFLILFLLINFSIIILVGYLVTGADISNPVSLIKHYYIVMNFIYSVFASMLILFPVKGKSIIHNHDRNIISPVLILVMFSQSVLLQYYTSQTWIALIFVFVFFSGNTFLPLYLSYGTLLSAFTSETTNYLSFDSFCRKFEVSPRETDIIFEICNGLSNKEISDKLFISLQTVKDHTHRIYIKTNVRSRVQLINLVRELKK